MIKKQKGVTLIELMISMMLGLALVSGISQLFIQSQRSFALQRNTSDMTEDGSFLLETLAKGVLLAGFSDTGTDFKCTTVKDSITGNVTSTTCPAINPMQTQTNVLNSGLNLDCTNTTVANITDRACETVHGNDNTLIYRYVIGSAAANYTSAGELNNFIGTSGLTGSVGDTISVYIYEKKDANGIPTVYCSSENTTTGQTLLDQPLISEVQKLVLKYGIYNKTTDKYYYTTAANVADWTPIFAIKAFFVLRSVDDHLTHSKISYTVDEVVDTATDNRLYRVFSKTIYLRINNH